MPSRPRRDLFEAENEVPPVFQIADIGRRDAYRGADRRAGLKGHRPDRMLSVAGSLPLRRRPDYASARGRLIWKPVLFWAQPALS